MTARQRPTIAITINPELLSRIDRLASSATLSRSRFIENLLFSCVETIEELETAGLWSSSNLMVMIKERFKEALTQRKLFEM